MAADVLGGGGRQDVGAVVDGPYQSDPHRVVHDQRDAGVVRDGRNGLEVRHVELGVADRLGVYRPRPRRDRPPHGVRIPRVDEADRASELGEGMMEEVVRPPVEVVGRDDLVAEAGDRQERVGDGRLARGHTQSASAALEGGDTLLEDIGRRVHQARVDVAELFERKEIGSMLTAPEHVRHGLVDGHGPCSGSRVRLLAGVQREGIGSEGTHGP